MKTAILCSIPDCNSPIKCTGLCNRHYQRMRIHGDPNTVTRTYTSSGEPMRFIRSLPSSGDGCVIWPFGKNAAGYGLVSCGRHSKNASRIVCEIVRGAPPNARAQAAHTCGRGNQGCVAPWHLRWASPAENQADRIGHGTDGRGERNAAAKLTHSQVHQIRALIGTSLHREIAAQFGITRQTVGDIASGRRWGHAL